MSPDRNPSRQKRNRVDDVVITRSSSVKDGVKGNLHPTRLIYIPPPNNEVLTAAQLQDLEAFIKQAKPTSHKRNRRRF